MTHPCERLKKLVRTTLQEEAKLHAPHRVFVSVGSSYWNLLPSGFESVFPNAKMTVAFGSIGGRASQLSHWLRPFSQSPATAKHIPGPLGGDDLIKSVTLLGKTLTLSKQMILDTARKSLLAHPVAARRFETWFVAVDEHRIAPKWLVGQLFGLSVARFRTADARRVLAAFGIGCKHACNY
jgi:hypothetical protein